MQRPAPARRHWRRALIALLACGLLGWMALVALVRPSNDRDWSPDQALLAQAEFDGDAVLVRNLRQARYRSASDYDLHWQDRRYDLSQLQSLWFVVVPFSDWHGPAHTFLSFGFADDDYLAISVEVRKERDESFSPLKGLLRQFELAYVVSDERDLIGLRAKHRGDDVYLYPIRSTAAGRRALLESMLQRANALAASPEFYNTLSNNCTSNIIDHIQTLLPTRIWPSYKTLLPAHTDLLAYDLGLIDTTIPRDQIRAAHLIKEQAIMHAEREDFSIGIRSSLHQD